MLGLRIVMFGFFKVTYMEVAVTNTVVSVGKRRCVFSFFQLDIFLEIVACLCIVFPMESDIAQVVISQRVHFVIGLGGQLQVGVEIAGCLYHSVETII